VKTLRIGPTEDDPAAFPNELSRQKLGREWLVTVRDYVKLSPGSLKDVTETIDLSLEEIFVALVKDSGGPS